MSFSSYHPGVIILYFIPAFFCCALFDQPIFTAISYGEAFACALAVGGRRSLIPCLITLPFVPAYALYYWSFHHFGLTVVRENFAGNSLTMESFLFGLSLGARIAAFFLLILCLFHVFSTDKLIYLTGRVWPRLSLYLAVCFRGFPRMRQASSACFLGRAGIGFGLREQGISSVKNALKVASAAFSWLLESYLISARSMESRGYSLKGRTAFAIYRFDNRDRGLVVLLCLLLACIGAGAALDQTRMLFDPQIIINRITPLSCLFYAAYAAFMLTPVLTGAAAGAGYKRNLRRM